MKYFWINLDRAETRRDNMLKQFEENEITEHYRVNAYLSPLPVKRQYENACCRSHLQAMSHFLLDSNEPYALICEDDLTFELKKYWRHTLEEIVKLAPPDWGIIQLATIIQFIESKFGHRDLFFKWQDQKSSSCLAYIIHRNCAAEILNNYIRVRDIFHPATPDCWTGGIYQKVDKLTKYNTYTYKYPMYIYPDVNDSQLENSLSLHIACKRELIKYLEKNKEPETILIE